MNYDCWADALAKFWLADDGGGPVILALEPHILVDVAETIGAAFTSAELATESFVGEVQAYQKSLGSRPWRVESSRTPPRFLLLIAIQVYAASQMDDDPGRRHTRDAYYIQLESLVGEQAMSTNFAADHGKAHRALWKAMKTWLSEHNRTINLPSDAPGNHERNVGLPKSQALLRLGDLAELPLFFRKCGYQPNGEYSFDRVQNDVEHWSDSYQAFPSSWARAVLKEPLKFPTACRQIYQELLGWDGQWEIVEAGRRTNRRSNRAKFWFGINRKRSVLVSRIVDSDENSQLLSIRDVAILLEGKAIHDGSSVLVHRGLCLCRYDADDGAFKQVPAVEPGDRCLFATNENVPGAFDLLSKLVYDSKIATDTRWYRDKEDDGSVEALSGIPSLCTMVEFRVADPLPYYEWVDRDWHAFLKSPTAGLVPTGGLRYGQEWNWVVGAGPNVRIVGSRLPKSIAIDESEVAITSRIVSHSILSKRGEHIVRAKIDGEERQCKILVSDPVEPHADQTPKRSWVFEDNAARWQEAIDGKEFLHGMRFSTPKSSSSLAPAEEQRTALRLLAGHPLTRANRQPVKYNHGLVRSLVRTRAK